MPHATHEVDPATCASSVVQLRRWQKQQTHLSVLADLARRARVARRLAARVGKRTGRAQLALHGALRARVGARQAVDAGGGTRIRLTRARPARQTRSAAVHELAVRARIAQPVPSHSVSNREGTAQIARAIDGAVQRVGGRVGVLAAGAVRADREARHGAEFSGLAVGAAETARIQHKCQKASCKRTKQ